MKLGAQFVEKFVSTSNIYNSILAFSFCLMSLIIPKFHNYVFPLSLLYFFFNFELINDMDSVCVLLYEKLIK